MVMAHYKIKSIYKKYIQEKDQRVLPANVPELLHELDLPFDELELLHVGEILGHQGQLQGSGHTCREPR